MDTIGNHPAGGGRENVSKGVIVRADDLAEAIRKLDETIEHFAYGRIPHKSSLAILQLRADSERFKNLTTKETGSAVN